MLEFFFRHYDPFVERYVVYDDGSTDATLEILRARQNVEVRRFERVVEQSFVLSAQRLHNEVWKESRGRADWAILTAVDEHLYHADLAGYLARSKRRGVTAVPALGFQMVAGEFPAPGVRLAETITRGAPYSRMNKLSILDPDAIAETMFSLGRHRGSPTGLVRFPDSDEVLNLHYKFLGIDYLRARQALLRTGLGEIDRQEGYGRQYLFDDAKVRSELAEFESRAFDVMAPGVDTPARHGEPRWWR
jgi:glycosyltransferase involved in cell wall biosynthesis